MMRKRQEIQEGEEQQERKEKKLIGPRVSFLLGRIDYFQAWIKM